MIFSSTWIPIERIKHHIQEDLYILGWVYFILIYLCYKFFFKKISERRHGQLRRRFSLTLWWLSISTIFTLSYWFVVHYMIRVPLISKFASYLGFLALVFGAMVSIRLAQLTLYLYLFFKNMSQGVPRLIVNIFTLVFSILVFFWLMSDLFDIRVAPLLATSAVFSLVLGLALQDTLGNLFSGLAMQIERPCEIGDWVEVQSGSEKWVGQIQEVTWRATLLSGFADETILISNKVMANSQIVILSGKYRSSRVGHVFKFKHDVSIATVKNAILGALKDLPEVNLDPEPRVLVSEVGDSWITVKVFYSIREHGTQFRTGDVVLTRIIDSLRLYEVAFALPSYVIKNAEET